MTEEVQIDETDEHAQAAATSAGEATPLCLNCLAEIEPRARFCSECRAPVGALVTYDPYHHIEATGWLLRRLVVGKEVPVLGLIATWAIYGPLTLGSAVALISITLARDVPTVERVLIWLIFAGQVLLFGTLLLKATRRFAVSRRLAPDRCVSCGYSLTNLTVPRCPECGTAISDSPDQRSGGAQHAPDGDVIMGTLPPRDTDKPAPGTPGQAAECRKR